NARVTGPNPGVNTATVSHADQFDPNTANNSASASTQPQSADLALAKSVDNPTPNVGDTVTFTVTLLNAGPITATGVTVSDLLPPGLQFVSADQSSYNSVTGVWTVGNIAANTTQVMHVQARVLNANVDTNTATISHSDQFDPNAGNNSSTSVVTPQQADL